MLYVNIKKDLGGFKIDVEFEMNKEVLVLFGPSGVGKSSVLELIAGVKEPDGGEVRKDNEVFYRNIPGKPAVNFPLNRRKIGYVFQEYNLFPHLTAFENVAYGMRGGQYGEEEIKSRVHELFRKLRLYNLFDHYPHQLSGGQKQRVAIARALCIEPDILLLDEPLSALDTMVREKIRQDILKVQDEYNISVIYVTHNLTDVFELADKVLIMNKGRVMDFGRRERVFFRPANRVAARFVESKNIFEMEAGETSKNSYRKFKSREFSLQVKSDKEIKKGKKVITTIRPEQIEILTSDKTMKKKNIFQGTVKKMIVKRNVLRLFVSSFKEKDFDFIVDHPRQSEIKVKRGKGVILYLSPDKIHVIDS